MQSRLRQIPLSVLFSSSLAGYVLLRLWFPFHRYYLTVPLRDVRGFTPSLAAGLAYAALLSALFGLHGLAYARVRRDPPRRPFLMIMLGSLLLAVPLLTTYPINATDLYRYAIRGRVSSVYGQSPFVSPPDAFAQDPYLPLAGEWAGETSPYGPLWEGAASVVTGVAPADFWLNLLSFKVLAALAFWLMGVLLWRILVTDPDRLSRAENAGTLLLWAWNPALLLIFIVDGHNDALMLLWLLLGWWFIRRRRPTIGFWVAVLAVLTKPIALLALPFLFLAAWRNAARVNSHSLSPRLGPFAPLVYVSQLAFVLAALGGGAALVTLAFLPFGSPLQLAGRLLREATTFAGFSPATLLILLMERLGWSLTVTQVSRLTTVLFTLAGAWLGWLALRGRATPRSIADAFIAYVWQALAFRIWYAAWPLIWLLVDDDDEVARRRRRVGLWFLFTTQLSVVIYGHVWQYLLAREFLWAHLVGVPFVFGLPWLATRDWRGRGKRLERRIDA